MDYEYDDSHEEYGGRILWGRFAFWGIALLLMFLLGRYTAGDGVSQAELQKKNEEIIRISSENEQLRQQLATQGGADAQSSDNGGGGTTGEGTADADTGGAAGAKTYTVKPNDTLNAIALELCGSIGPADKIAELNGLDKSNPLKVGQVLNMPPECTG